MAAALSVAAVALAGCGIGVGSGEQQHVTLLVTRDFGHVPVGGGAQTVEAPSSDTVMRLLERMHNVTTRYGGNFVQSIDGISGNAGAQRDWFFYVNGILADESATAIKPDRGDSIWWDRHDWRLTPDVRAVVGSFPEPFLHGANGKRYPVRLECADDAQKACDIGTSRLEEAGIRVVARARIGTTGGAQTLRIMVGQWPAIRADFVARRVEQGPAHSGVYARFSADGRRLRLLDARGHAVRTAKPGTGLIAASEDTEVEAAPIWLVTGVDEAGVEQAASALTEDALNGKFAVAIADDVPTALPVVE
jgi:hypothetical protein